MDFSKDKGGDNAVDKGWRWRYDGYKGRIIKNKITKMKLSKRTIGDLIVLIRHSQTDMNYGGGGTFSTGRTDKDGDWIYDIKEAEKAVRAIKFIEKLILNRE